MGVKIVTFTIYLYLTGCMARRDQIIDKIEYEDLNNKPVAVIVENTSKTGEAKIFYGQVKKETDGYVFENNRKTIKLTFDDDKLKRTKKVTQEIQSTTKSLKGYDYVLWLYMEDIEEPTSDMKKVGTLN
jgi:hypothetical protein